MDMRLPGAFVRDWENAAGSRMSLDLRSYLTFTYFRRLCAATSAA
jgi:hypothetical protein